MSVVCVLFCFSSRAFSSTQGELEILSHTVRFLFNDRKCKLMLKLCYRGTVVLRLIFLFVFRKQFGFSMTLYETKYNGSLTCWSEQLGEFRKKGSPLM